MTEKDKIILYLEILAEEAVKNQPEWLGQIISGTLKAAVDQIKKGAHNILDSSDLITNNTNAPNTKITQIKS